MCIFIDFPMLGFKIMLWIPKFLAQIGRSVHDIESSVATESSVFVPGFYRGLQFSIATCSLSFFLDSVAIDFDNVAIAF